MLHKLEQKKVPLFSITLCLPPDVLHGAACITSFDTFCCYSFFLGIPARFLNALALYCHVLSFKARRSATNIPLGYLHNASRFEPSRYIINKKSAIKRTFYLWCTRQVFYMASCSTTFDTFCCYSSF